MSSTIIYHRVVHKLLARDTGLQEDLLLVAAQTGSSNCYEFGRGNRQNGRRSRSWLAMAAGTRKTVMERLITIAGDLEGGMTKLSSGQIKPEGFIAGARKMLAADIQNYYACYPYIDGWFSLSFLDKPYWERDANNVVDMREWVNSPLVAKSILNGISIEQFIKVHGPDIRR